MSPITKSYEHIKDVIKFLFQPLLESPLTDEDWKGKTVRNSVNRYNYITQQQINRLKKENEMFYSMAYIKETIADIRTVFDISLRELADILHTTKYSIYSWINGESIPSDKDQERLDYIKSIVDLWRTYSDYNMNHSHTLRYYYGNSVYTLLKSGVVPDVYRGRFHQLADEIKHLNADKKQETKSIPGSLYDSIPTVSYKGGEELFKDKIKDEA